ncbi:MAG: CsbD family protein [Thermoanaerobaculia bacterium]
MNRDEREGKTENLKGRVKEATGALVDDEKLQKEGADQRAAGELQEDVGKLRRKAGEALEELGEKIKD